MCDPLAARPDQPRFGHATAPPGAVPALFHSRLATGDSPAYRLPQSIAGLAAMRGGGEMTEVGEQTATMAFTRPARARPPMFATAEIAVAAPPQPPRPARGALLAGALPIVMAAAMIALTAVGYRSGSPTGRNPVEVDDPSGAPSEPPAHREEGQPRFSLTRQHLQVDTGFGSHSTQHVLGVGGVAHRRGGEGHQFRAARARGDLGELVDGRHQLVRAAPGDLA